jgi:hypothetical protein
MSEDGESLKDVEILIWELSELFFSWESPNMKAMREKAYSLAPNPNITEEELVKLRDEYQAYSQGQINDNDTNVDPRLGEMLLAAVILRKSGDLKGYGNEISDMITYAEGMGYSPKITGKLELLLKL